jgi:hypothetical protein
MKIIIKINNNYGIETAYPVCEQAILFSRIAGTKTLTRDTLRHIDSLGYQIEIAEQVYKTFKHLTAA